MSGTNLVLSGANGIVGAPYYLLTSTSIGLPVTNWITLLTNVFGPGGIFSDNVPLDSAEAVRFYRVGQVN